MSKFDLDIQYVPYCIYLLLLQKCWLMLTGTMWPRVLVLVVDMWSCEGMVTTLHWTLLNWHQMVRSYCACALPCAWWSRTFVVIQFISWSLPTASQMFSIMLTTWIVLPLKYLIFKDETSFDSHKVMNEQTEKKTLKYVIGFHLLVHWPSDPYLAILVANVTIVVTIYIV